MSRDIRDIRSNTLQDRIQIKGMEARGSECFGETEIPSNQKTAVSSNITDAPRHKSDVSHLGLMTELRFQLEAAERGFDLWKPVDPFSRTDLVIRKNRRFYNIQVKGTYVTRKDGAYRVTLSSQAGRYKANDVDFYAAYIFPTDDWFIIPFAEAKHTFEVLPGGKSQLRYLDAWDLITESNA